LTEEKKALLQPGDGDIDKSKAVFAGAYQPSEEQLSPKKPGEPPSAASLSLVDKWIQVLEAIAEREEAALRREEAIFDEVRAHK
jgi:hypothetical protein